MISENDLRSVVRNVLLEVDAQTRRESEIETFENLKGSYKLQGHGSDEREIELRNVSDVEVGNKHINKPYKGFWTSTVFQDAETFKTKWSDFGSSEALQSDYFHVFTIKGSPNVLHVGSRKKAETVYNEYSTNWSRIANEFDAFHVYKDALTTSHYEYWDIESTVWFRPKDHLKKQFVWKV